MVSLKTDSRSLLQRLTATRLAVPGLVLRLALAVVMFPHGAQKLLGWFGGPGFSETIAGFDRYFGIPAALAVVAILTEFLAPVALALGIFTRIAALGLAVNMLVAMRYHLANGFFMNWTGNQAGEGFEFHLLLIGAAIALLIGGAGRWSLDRRLAGDETGTG
jgi:putative oxidoreductase